jgi:hypothetical protein
VALEFAEYESAAGIVQDRQGAAGAQQAAPQAALAPIVSDQQRRGLGTMEARFAST